MANWRIFPNSGSSYLTTAVASGDTTVTVQSGTTFPAPASGQEYKIRIDSEFLLVTGVTGGTLTCTRGADGSTAAAHAVGALVFTCISQDDLQKCSTQCNPPTTSGVPANPTYAAPLQMAFDPATGKLYVWNGTAWKSTTLT